MNTTKLIVCLLLLTVLTGCVKEEEPNQEKIDRTGFVLGTVASITLFDHGSEALLDRCFERLAEIEETMTLKGNNSEVVAINSSQGPVSVSEDTFNVIKSAVLYGDLSDGRFDITFGPLTEAWMIGTEDQRVPSLEEISDLLPLVDYKKIQLKSKDLTVQTPVDTKVDLGGIAKGFAADEVADILRASGVEGAIINLGGNVKVVGEKAKDTPFRIGIQSPFDERNAYMGILDVSDQTVVTSGDYERYFIEDGVKYHHIFDKTTGYPVVTDIASVTVVAKESIAADALSTALYVLGVDKGIELVNSLEDTHCIYVMRDKTVVVSDDYIKDRFTLTDPAFKIMER